MPFSLCGSGQKRDSDPKDSQGCSQPKCLTSPGKAAAPNVAWPGPVAWQLSERGAYKAKCYRRPHPETAPSTHSGSAWAEKGSGATAKRSDLLGLGNCFTLPCPGRRPARQLGRGRRTRSWALCWCLLMSELHSNGSVCPALLLTLLGLLLPVQPGRARNGANLLGCVPDTT